ncbi:MULTISPECIES: aspartate aminotransferase family protein [Oceanibaculum]|uniref:Beta alanine--pyruvate transaminase n=2 Tax=Oceanibaculum indicum TaxID=526216 RepID=K2JMA2_9PROT|nr:MULTISPECIES: aspartate aminotransferase family protein [Oceanibaculum]EKE76463.1 beta alanine--pyruvate transaminase [Oceanibaculum indicum P24]MCH2393123.1 aspartate aminotransferase family protein [Oceanibaculum sp.]RKQ70448.1 beta-alanine--pyruvate transaminase [Oceanibaculum indicum]
MDTDYQDITRPNDLESFWMPFTANRAFKKNPRMLVEAEGMHYTTADGRRILDGTAGLWCVNAGHRREKIVKAIQKQAEKLDYAPSFQMGHPLSFELASRLTTMLPGYDRVFFTGGGSESVDTALKIAIAYHRVRGEGARTRLIGRERGYHGVGFGGISVGGIVANRKFFGSLLPGVDHLPHTHSPENQAFTRGQPAWGGHLADELERIVALHDASTVAAVIVEPVAGSTGVLIPPQGYLQKLRQICDKHGILLIFDEVITGFGRLGSSFATEHFGVKPDLITTAKGLTNGCVPMGAVFAKQGIYDTFMDKAPEGTIELFHGYTYSGHPLAAAAGLATLDVYKEEGLFERAAELAPYWEDAVHSLKGTGPVIDLRNLGIIAGIELEGIPGKPTARAMEAFTKAYEKGLLIRTTGDIIALSPPLILEKSHIDEMFGTLGDVLKTLH